MEIDIYNQINCLAKTYALNLQKQVALRVDEMKQDDTSYYLLYRILGIPDDEGRLIDLYQNKGRFLYQYAGAFLEEATMLCMKNKYPEASKVKIPNAAGLNPKTFEIDCLVGSVAHEIKWRDATTDGDHIAKEHARVQAIKHCGYTPVRIMFYYPQREQAKKIQETLETLYLKVGGTYYYSSAAWRYVKDFTGIDLLAILKAVANSREET